jgi:hypothetical protein
MGLAAHALDELNGRPLRTRIPGGVLIAIAVVGLGGAIAFGVHGVIEVSPWLWAFIVAGAFLVVAYNMELFGGVVHSDLWFALAWGAGACAAISAAQRTLSTPVRRLRRTVVGVRGEVELNDGTRERIDASTIRDAPERALRWLSLAMPLVATALVIARL